MFPSTATAGVREAAKKAYSAAWFAQDKLQFQAKQWRDKGRADKADAMEPKIAEAVATLKRMKVRDHCALAVKGTKSQTHNSAA